MRLHQLRTADFRRGRRLSKGDHIVTWAKPQRPDWLDQDTYDSLPDQLEIREVQVPVAIPGFRTESLVVVTSLLDPEEVPADEATTRCWATPDWIVSTVGLGPTT